MCYKFVLSVALALCMCGCGIYTPSYHEPKFNVPKSWRYGTVSDDNMPYVFWWRRFHDNELSDLIDRAIENNNDIQVAIGNIIQAQGNLEQVRFAWIPVVNTNMNVNYSSSPVVNNSSNQIVNNSSYGLGLLPSYTINILQLLRQEDQAKHNILVREYARDAIILGVVSQMASSYFALSELRYQLQLQGQLVADGYRQLEIATQQYRQGYISLLELQQYKQQYQAFKAESSVVMSNIVQTENTINVLVNRAPQFVAVSNFDKLDSVGVIPANLPSTVLKNRPDVLQAGATLQAANDAIGVARANFFPNILLTGVLSTTSTQLQSLFTQSARFWQTNIASNLPLINAAVYGVVDSAKGAYYSAYYSYMKTVQNAFADVDNTLAAHQYLTDNYNAQLSLVDSSKLAYEISRYRWLSGADSELLNLTYKIKFEQAALTLAQAKLQKLQSVVNLYKALSGGYKYKYDTIPVKKFNDKHDV